MNVSNSISFLTVVLLGVSPLSSHATGTSQLLGQQDENVGGTWFGNVPVVKTITGMQFFFGYQMPFTNVSYGGGTYSQVNEQQLSQTVGGNLSLTKGQTGIFDFTSANSPAFNSVASMLTDGVDQTLTDGGFGFNPDRIVTGGAFGSGSDNARGLAGAQIDFFRLIVTDVNWGPVAGGGFNISGVATWQIYGTPVPEPSTNCLCGLGLFFLLLSAYRGKHITASSKS